MSRTGPIRLGLVCPYDLDVPGGVREQVMGHAVRLAAAGHTVDVLAPRGRGAPAHEELDGVRVTSAGPPVALRTNGSTARLAVGPSARRRAAVWARGGPGPGFDLVHVHEPIPPGIGHTVLRALAADRRTARTAGGPAVVATVHVALAPWPAGRSRSLRTASRHVGGLLDGVDVLTAVSEHARRTLVDHLGRVPLVVPNAVDVDAWAAARPDRSHDGPVVVVLGRADEPRKGVDVLLRAWPRVLARVPDARLAVVGPTRRAALPAGAPRVHLVGRVDEDAKRALVAGADVLVAPHRGGESFGIVLVEAMAAGTPVVASDLPAFRDVLDGTGVLVPPGDPSALAAAVADVLLARGPQARERVAAARRRATGYGWPVVEEAWQRLHELALELVAPPGGAEGRGRRRGPGGPAAALRRALQGRARLAARLADGDDDGAPVPGWADVLGAAARAAADVDDLPAQNRLTALVRSAALPEPVAAELAWGTARLAAVRSMANDAALRRGTPTTELDDDPLAPSGARVTWPWCPSLPGCAAAGGPEQDRPGTLPSPPAEHPTGR